MATTGQLAGASAHLAYAALDAKLLADDIFKPL